MFQTLLALTEAYKCGQTYITNTDRLQLAAPSSMNKVHTPNLLSSSQTGYLTIILRVS